MGLAKRIKNVLFVYLIYGPSKQNKERVICLFNLWA